MSSSWTVDTLKAHFDQRIADGEKAVSAALAAAEKAVNKAEENATLWRAQSNEWRGAMDDREIKFSSRIEVDAELRTLRAEINALKVAEGSGAGGRRTTDAFRSNAMFIVGAIMALIAIWRAFSGN